MPMNWVKLLNAKRPRTSTSPGDHRVEFERDYDRSIFSTPVKRLQDKAQVFPLEPHDAVRTRLTHSLEVSSVARGLGIAVAKWLIEQKEISADDGRSIEAILATCGLIHDLGNPPFGHSGEDAIREWFRESFKGNLLPQRLECEAGSQIVEDFLRFEGNAQSLRLVSKLQILADFHGLNLTFGTLSASCKYVAASNQICEDDHAKSKPGYFASESALIAQIRDETGTGPARNPLTYLVEAADDIVYSVADVEDAIKKGVLTWQDARLALETTPSEALKSALAFMDRILKTDHSEVPKDLPDDRFGTAFRTAAIAISVRAVVETFKEKYPEIMEGTYKGELVAACSSCDLIRALKRLGATRVYCTPSNLKLELMGRRVIKDLMTLFWQGAEQLPTDGAVEPKKFSGKVGALLSESYRRVFVHCVRAMPELPVCYHRFQLVTDYVCGMTDTFAKRLHSELFNG